MTSESTAEILDLLAAYGIRAEFFAIGFRAVQRPDLVKRAGADHVVGNHTWDHVPLARLDNDDHVTEKLRQTNDAIEQILGAPPTLFRGPWLCVDDRVKRLAGDLGLTHVDVHVDTNDYDHRYDADYVANTILAAQQGQIVLPRWERRRARGARESAAPEDGRGVTASIARLRRALESIRLSATRAPPRTPREAAWRY
jgi:peptidoglycan/xylan/chitin deacetylase (PgdA/CDA1 family)